MGRYPCIVCRNHHPVKMELPSVLVSWGNLLALELVPALVLELARALEPARVLEPVRVLARVLEPVRVPVLAPVPVWHMLLPMKAIIPQLNKQRVNLSVSFSNLPFMDILFCTTLK